MISSFVSEHSVEFIIVPSFIELIKPYYKRIVPLYFWASREGSKMALHSLDKVDKLRIVALFARRPKVKYPDQKEVTVKFNNELFRYSLEFTGIIPVFAGVPLVSTLYRFEIETPCRWFYLRNNSGDINDHFATIDIETGALLVCTSDTIQTVVSETLTELITNNIKYIYWKDAVDLIRTTRRSIAYDGFNYGSIYKPVYFLLLDHD